MFSSRHSFVVGLAVLAAVLGWTQAEAQSPAWPTKLVRIVVAYPPGGTTDVFARMIAAQLSPRWGQAVIVENRTGAAGTIGANAVAKAAADGHTLLMGASLELFIVRNTMRTMPYDTTRDFAPIMLVCEFPFVMVINPSVPAQNLREFLQLGKDRPQYLTYGSIGRGSAGHLIGALIAQRGGIALNHVAYRGSVPLTTDLISGQIHMALDTISTAGPHIGTGKLRALAIAAEKRSPLAPNVPTFAEAGLSGIVHGASNGLLAPAGTPPGILHKIWQDLDAIMRTDFAASLRKRGAEPRGTTAEEYKAYIASEVTKWAALAHAAGVEPE
jgi:tripartite-type tricarboxylate transporter receptor subunit TctC